MTKREQDRKERLLPNGIPRWIRIYDNATTADNFTIVFSGKGYKYEGHAGRYHPIIAMGPTPHHPQGFCQHDEYDFLVDRLNGKWPPAIGRKCHLGKRITFQDLPQDCQEIVLRDYKEYWEIK